MASASSPVSYRDTTSERSAATTRSSRPTTARIVRSALTSVPREWLRMGANVPRISSACSTGAPLNFRPIPSPARPVGVLGGWTRRSSIVSTAAGKSDADIRARPLPATWSLARRSLSTRRRSIPVLAVQGATQLILTFSPLLPQFCRFNY